jgi:hypothetical protein
MNKNDQNAKVGVLESLMSTLIIGVFLTVVVAMVQNGKNS